MPPRVHSVLHFCLGAVPGLLALGGLVVLGYWGHSHEWRIPRLAELVGSSEPKEEKSAEKSSEEGPNFDKPIQFDSPEAVEKAGIQTAVAEERRMPEYISAPGIVEYDHFRLAHLASPVQGTVWRILRRHGQRVKPGEALALINSAEVGRAKAEFLQAQMLVGQRTKILRQLNPTLVQVRQVEEAEMNLQDARLRRLTAEQALANLGLPVTQKEFDGMPEEELARRMRFLGLPEELKSDLERETLTANLYPLRAPFDGVVVDHDIALGEVVSTMHTQPLFTVADLERMWIRLDVRVEDVGRIKHGQELSFRPDQSMPARTTALRKLARLLPFSPLSSDLPAGGVKGVIEWISPEVDEKTRTVKLHAHVDNPGGRLLANGFGTGRVLVHETPSAIVVPSQAVQEAMGKDGPFRFVFVRVDGVTFQPRIVTTGARDENLIEMLTGVRPEEVVVTVGSHALKSQLLRSLIGSED